MKNSLVLGVIWILIKQKDLAADDRHLITREARESFHPCCRLSPLQQLVLSTVSFLRLSQSSICLLFKATTNSLYGPLIIIIAHYFICLVFSTHGGQKPKLN